MDLLRRASWRLTSHDKTKSTRGGHADKISIEDKELSRQDTMNIKMSTCALGGDELREPVYCCKKGNLYNLEAVLEYLLGQGRFEHTKDKLKETFGHITSKKSVFPVSFTKNEAAQQEAEKGDSHTIPRFKCPVTGLISNGHYPFVALKGCGHCFSEKALKLTAETKCVVCGKEFSKKDAVVIGGNEQDQQDLDKELKKGANSKHSKKRKGGNNGESTEDHDNKKDKKESTEKLTNTTTTTTTTST